MALASRQTISFLKETAKKLSSSSNYQWGHMGSCNCGFLAQEVTRLSKTEIHQRAMTGHGDWTEQLNDYCPSSGLLMDDLIDSLLEVGFTRNDLRHLEYTSDPEVLDFLPEGKRFLEKNKKGDVVLYLESWADLLESKMMSTDLIASQTREIREVEA